MSSAGSVCYNFVSCERPDPFLSPAITWTLMHVFVDNWLDYCNSTLHSDQHQRSAEAQNAGRTECCGTCDDWKREVCSYKTDTVRNLQPAHRIIISRRARFEASSRATSPGSTQICHYTSTMCNDRSYERSVPCRSVARALDTDTRATPRFPSRETELPEHSAHLLFPAIYSENAPLCTNT